jgi:predicted GH43/DUF377 family glycosyl hydrolase
MKLAVVCLVAACALLVLARHARQCYARWLRTTFRPVNIYMGFVNQDVQPFSKYQVEYRYLPLDMVPQGAHLAVRLPPVPVRDLAFRSYNPGVFTVGDEAFAVMRVSNYTLRGDIVGKIRSENFLYSFRQNRYRHIQLPDTQSCLALGFEDARAFAFRGGVWLLTTSFNHQCINKMHLVQLDVSEVLGNSKAPLLPLSLVLLTPDSRVGAPQDMRQKNWMPFVHGNELFMVYALEPHVVLRCDVQTGACVLFSNAEVPRGRFPVPGMRGSTNAHLVTGTKWGDIYVAFTHTTQSLLYSTYVYAFEARPPFKVVAASAAPIHWARTGAELPYVEFTCGFAIVHRNGVGHWVVSFGQNDCKAYVAIMTETHGLSLLSTS